MPITSFEIQNVETIEYVKCENVPQLMVIAGPNGVGKSTLLETIRKRLLGENPPTGSCNIDTTGSPVPMYISPHRTPFPTPLHRSIHHLVPQSDYTRTLSLSSYSFSGGVPIPALISEYEIIEIPIDQRFNIDIPELITNLRHYSKKKGSLYALIDHEKFDRYIISAFEESKIEVTSLKDSFPEQVNQLNIIRENLLPLFWMNISFALSKYIQEALLNNASYDYVAQSIYNIFQELIHKLILHMFDKVCLTIAPSKKNSEIKRRIEESSAFVFPKGRWPVSFHFISHLYYNGRVSPGSLMELTFLGNKVNAQKIRIEEDHYKGLKAYPPPMFPANEIFDSDWYQIIVPQFLSFEIMRATTHFHSMSQNDLDNIGLRIWDYDELYYSTSSY